MKKGFALTIIVMLALTGCKNNSVTFNGRLENHTLGETIYLDKLLSDRLEPFDSVQVGEGGKFTFRFEVTQPSFFLVRFNQKNFLTLVVEPGEKITFESNRDSLNFPTVISGSKGTENVVKYNNTLRTAVAGLTKLNEVYNASLGSPRLPAIVDSLDKAAADILSGINLYTKNYIDSNLGSLETLMALYQQVAPAVPVLKAEKDLQYFIKVDSALFARFPLYEPVVSLHRQVEQLKESFRAAPAPEPGERTLAPEISLPTPQGDTVKLSSTRGSIVLLDFWASWCGPCRKENPNLVKAYDKYHRKGFQIYQVSLDKTKEAWIKGIEEDKLGRWIHVSDIKYWQSVVVPLYNIESIPSNFLLDREGNVIATKLRGDALIEKLAEVFGK